MAYADDSLNVHHMNIKEGGSELLMHDTIYNSKHILMSKVVKNPTVERVAIPRGMINALQITYELCSSIYQLWWKNSIL